MDNQQIGFSFSKKRRRDNRVGKVMKAIAVIIYIAGFIVGLVFHSSAGLMFAAWGAGFISGSFFLAIAEIIFLLDSFFEPEVVSGDTEITCSSCGASLSADAQICPQCGTPVSTPLSDDVCTFCGSNLPAGVQVCPKCGTLISAAKKKTPASSETPVSAAAAAESPSKPAPASPANDDLPGIPL